MPREPNCATRALKPRRRPSPRKAPAAGAVATKALMRGRDPLCREQHGPRRTRIFSAQLKTAEAKEAFAAFAEKRQPDFSKVA